MDEIHGGLCIKSIKEVIVETEIPITENFDFGDALSSIYPLLEIVFKYLPYSDLKSCSDVCDSWKKVALKAMQNRIALSYFTCYRNTEKVYNRYKPVSLVPSGNLHFNNIALGVILLDSSRLSFNKFVCLHKSPESCTKAIVVPELLQEELIPKSVDYCLLSVPSVFSNFDKSRLRLEIKSGSLFDGVFIPQIPDIKIVMFHCNPSKRPELRETINTYKKFDETVKCLLLFCKVAFHDSLQDMLMVFTEDNIINGKHPSQMALGGGIIRGTNTFQVDSQEKKVYRAKDTVCIAFLEKRGVPSNFLAYSFVIKGQALTTEEFERELTKFRERCKLKKHSFCFLIRCCAKYDKENEVLSFEKIFNGVPMLGLDSAGEIGWDSTECDAETEENQMKYAKKPKRKKKSLFPAVNHCWSSVFVVLTWE